MAKNGNVHPTRIFQNEEDLESVWEEFKKYLRDVEDKEWNKIQYVGKDGGRVADPQKVPYTFEGFKRYCRSIKKIGNIEQYFTNQDGYYDDFIGICRAIKEEIRENQIIGGMLNFYNPSITQRLNGLVDKTENKVEATVNQIDYSQLSEDALNEIAKLKS